MAQSDFDVAIVGGGAAGIAAARRLQAANVNCLLLEARDRLGGRAWTVNGPEGSALDLGCGWLHSADRNPWVAIAQAQGRILDKTPPPWARLAPPQGFPLDEQHEFSAALDAFFERVGEAARAPDRPAADLLEAGGRWNGLIGAVATYITGAELSAMSVRDFDNYADSGVNWRVADGFGAVIATHAGDVPVALDCPVQTIDHSGARLKLKTAKGTLTAEQVIVALPSALIAEQALHFAPALPEKIEAAAGLPLGLNDKLFLALERAEEFAPGTRLFGHTDRVATASYHVRPFGRAQIEVFFGGDLAWKLEAAGERGFVDFAVGELTALFGSGFATRVTPIRMHAWGRDPFARGSYSCALPGKADSRARLAAPVDGRLFFAGEACSTHDFSTAHGALLTGIAAADAVLTARRARG
jgi:monoamine oxidase